MSQRLVVNLVGDAHDGRLAESRFVDKLFVFGGELTAMQLAFAAAAAGHEVELRGWLHEPTFRRFADAVGASPHVELEARAPSADDLVVVPEGWDHALPYLRLALSPARLTLLVLAAPGLFGWPFSRGWSLPNPLSVDIGTLARPEHFAGMRALGFELVTNSEGLVHAAAAAGVECRFLGTGSPWSLPEPAEKRVDAIGLLANRWAPLVRDVVEQLQPDTVDLVDEVSNDEVLERMARARVLIWPSRVEGHARIPHEARSVGCVPVALSTNPFAVGLDEAHGSMVVDEVGQLAPAIRALLDDPGRLAGLARKARDTAREQVEWQPFVDRVAEWLAAPPPSDPGRGARAHAGAELTEAIARERGEAQRRLEERFGEIEQARIDLTAATRNQEELIARVSELEQQLKPLSVRAAAGARKAYRRLRGR